MPVSRPASDEMGPWRKAPPVLNGRIEQCRAVPARERDERAPPNQTDGEGRQEGLGTPPSWTGAAMGQKAWTYVWKRRTHDPGPAGPEAAGPRPYLTRF